MLTQINFVELRGVTGLKSDLSDIGSVVGALIPYFFAAAGFLLIIYLVLGGLEFIFSLGDPKKTASAKGKITHALLGFLVVFAAYLIVQLVGLIFNVTDITNIFK